MRYVYILRCNDKSLYTGITKDIERRVDEHNNSPIGAKYTKNKRPVQLVWFEEAKDRSIASKREREIKKLGKLDKEKLISG